MYLVDLEQKCVHLVQVSGKVNEKRNCIDKGQKNVGFRESKIRQKVAFDIEGFMEMSYFCAE